MSATIQYETESTIVETDDDSRLQLTTPAVRYVKVEESDGTIRLIPLAALHESERAILENPELYRETRQGIRDFMDGRGVSSDWLFDDE